METTSSPTEATSAKFKRISIHYCFVFSLVYCTSKEACGICARLDDELEFATELRKIDDLRKLAIGEAK